MNDDFEKNLLALASNARRPDPTAAWKAEILARARREATPPSPSPSPRPHKLMLAWAAAWLAILAMYFTMPEEHNHASHLRSTTSPLTPSPQLHPTQDPHSPTLFALQQRWEQDLELP
jgi:hypothetical protein